MHRILLFLILVALLRVSGISQPSCRLWEVDTLSGNGEDAPPALAGPFTPTTDTIDGFIRETYSPSANSLIHEWLVDPVVLSDSAGNPMDYDWRSKISVANGADTTVVDTARYGFSPIAVFPGSSAIAYFKETYLGEDIVRGNILLYNLRKRDSLLVYLRTGYTEPSVSPDNRWLAFSDFGDLYLFDLRLEAPLLVFNGGGSANLGSDCPSHTSAIENIMWSPDSKSVYFDYLPVSWDSEAIRLVARWID